MRKWIWISTYVVLLAVLAYTIWPFVGLYQLGHAVHAADADDALSRIDLRLVRRSLVNQVLDEGMQSGQITISGDENAQKFILEAAAAALDAKAAEILSPEMLRRLIAEGNVSALIGGETGGEPNSEQTGEIPGVFALPRNPLGYLRAWHLSSPVTFRVVLGPEDSPGDQVGLTLRRTGVTWLLTQIRLPEKALSQIRRTLQERMQQV